MFTSLTFFPRCRQLLLLGQVLVLIQPMSALAAFQSGSGQESMLSRFTIANVQSWEEYKRIRQTGGSVANSAADDTATAEATTVPRTKATSSAQAKPSPQVITNIHRPAAGKPVPHQITAPIKPTEQGDWWAYFAGKMNIHANPYYDPHGIDFKWAYSRKNPLPKNPRIVVLMHGSGCGEGCMEVFGPSEKGDIEVRTQDAEAYNQDWREWWTFGRDGTPYPGRRVAAALDFLVARYQIDTSKRGIVLDGPSMGGAGAVVQTMILPDPWRRRIAYSSASAGVIMPRQIAQKAPDQYISFPPDNPSNRVLWDSIDFSVQAAVDPIVRGIHYRHAFSSDDPFSAGLHGSTQLEFVNLVERYKISGAFTWIKDGHAASEAGVAFPDITQFESVEQDVTLDRAHPAITNSTGNFPLRAADRTDEAKYPRGHYNMGINWNHAKIVDEASQIVFPLKYNRRTGIGKGVPDQPLKITVSVTPRRARNFVLNDGETLKWSWDGGARAGVATVTGDTVTVDAIPLVSGGDYKTLRIYR
jgi:hypothetical protein